MQTRKTPTHKMQTYTVGELAKLVGLSRSALLYYDRIGLLSPSGRTHANYRTYSHEDRLRLERICHFRELGLGLKEIGRAIDEGAGRVDSALVDRLEALGEEMAKLREQQRVIVRLLGRPPDAARNKALDKKTWVGILRSAGLDDDAMMRWHAAFEAGAPDAHREFLRSLGIAAADVEDICARSQQMGRG